MHKIDNHHGGKTTWFIGDLCINGCQTFTLANAEDVFAEYDVSDEHRADVYKHLPQPDWDMEGADTDTRRGVAENPSTPASVLTTLSTDSDAWVRWGVARNPSTQKPM